ncbi:MAG: hypothetical protein ACI80N_002239, partial [Gammaproteobacteria bacterium]
GSRSREAARPQTPHSPPPPMAQPASDRSFSDDVATLYESTLVPLIFEPYADDLAARARGMRPGLSWKSPAVPARSRALATALPASCVFEATDLNVAMVNHTGRVGTGRPATWRQVDVMRPH